MRFSGGLLNVIKSNSKFSQKSKHFTLQFIREIANDFSGTNFRGNDITMTFELLHEIVKIFHKFIRL